MSDESSVPPAIKKRLDPTDKAARTTKAATDIIGQEQRSSEAKTARLRALRMNAAESIPAKESTASGKAVRARPKAATVRSLALQGDGEPRKRK